VNRYASALSRHPVPAHAVGETAGEILEQLGADDADLLVCFVSPHLLGALDDMVHAIQNLLEPGVLLAMSTGAVVGDAREVEDGPALAVFAARLPDVRLTPVALHVEETPDGASVVGWPDLDGTPETLLLLADPFTFPVDAFLRRSDEDRSGLTVVGGLASAATRPGANRLVLDDRIVAEGAVGVFLEGAGVGTVVSQGCRPVGRPLVVTRSDGSFVQELAGRPALDRLRELADEASEGDRALLQAGLHLGVVVDEHRTDFSRGDFLVRTVIGADRETGAIAVGDQLQVGQTVQFHVRDAAAADEDLRALLLASSPAGTRSGAGALLFTCNGRGSRLFGVPDHDAGLIEELLGPLPLAGGSCAGEIGPVGGRNFLHGFTASLALFPPESPGPRSPSPTSEPSNPEEAEPGPAHAS
jgi:small ligand-binding sensory domain FIST